ncbi:linker for activation of T-cells family member 2 isoform X3 [Sapajus apella]|uniref:Linker for activation of T-cells family member 2 isoform X3 n=1 Tax=Sapajus apella TaxID=9515 RepID=A0A6J3FZS3_SAPAP|nr:linker for activation of T-cells family member 2 isoform X3 [Sapajus apella]
MIQWLAETPPCPPASVSGVGIAGAGVRAQDGVAAVRSPGLSEPQEATPGASMNPGTELLWPGAALLVLLGVAASLCVRCFRPGAKRSEKIYQQRSLREDQQSFMGSQTYSLVGQAWPGPLAETAPARKDKLLQFSPSLEDPASSRDPIAMEYYNWGRFSKPPEDDDANSYENVLICKQKTTEPGAQQEGTGGLCGEHSPLPALKTDPTSSPCPSVPLEEDEESEDYQNSASIRQWRESRRAMGQVQREASPRPAGSPDEEEDGEPDYVNGEVAVSEA